MKPLSSVLYSKRNKRKIFASVNAVILSTSFLFILYTFTGTITTIIKRNELSIYNNLAVVKNYEEKLIPKDVINSIEENENVDRIIPTIFNYGLRFSIPGATTISIAVPIRTEDREYFMSKLGINLISGELPKDGSKEIALNSNIAKNRNIKLFDKVGDSINKNDSLPGEYTVVGIINSESLISILSTNESIFPKYKDSEYIKGIGFYVFPKEGNKENLNKYLSLIEKGKATVITKERAMKKLEEFMGAIKVIDVIAILSIFVMVITVGSSKYAQYINRKEELGLLNALGYNKNQILLKTFKEVVLVNIFGFIIGITFGVIFSYLINRGLWSKVGANGLLFTSKGFVVAIFVPMFTILFSIIPINNLINKLDPIKMIEKN